MLADHFITKSTELKHDYVRKSIETFSVSSRKGSLPGSSQRKQGGNNIRWRHKCEKKTQKIMLTM